MTVRVKTSVSGRVVVTTSIGRRKVIATTSLPASAGAITTLRLRPTSGSIRRLRRTHVKRLTLTVTLILSTENTRAKRTAIARVVP